jgi:ubiquinol-cytochrome c reductase cytochrome b subunit
MSLWGMPKIAPNAFIIIFILYFFLERCLVNIFQGIPTYKFNAALRSVRSNLSKYSPVRRDAESTSKNLNSDSKIREKRLRADKRIGPHNYDIISIIYGSLLGDSHAEYRSIGKGTRITFYQESKHSTYLIWLHKLISELGYSNPVTPIIQTRLGNKGTIRKIIRFRTWTYSSFNWIHDLWYKNNVKVVPLNIGEYLTPLALAIWIMDDGTKAGTSLKFATNSFTYSECLLLIKVLDENFKIKASVQSAGCKNQYIIYIWKESMPRLLEIVLPYVHPSMKYKLSY